MGLSAVRLTLLERASQACRIASQDRAAYIGAMSFSDGSSIVARLTTVGRKSGQPRTVELRLICYQGCFYASSSRVSGKHWCQNMLKNPSCEISFNGQRVSCTARQVSDHALRRRILEFRDAPSQMERVVFEIRPPS